MLQEQFDESLNPQPTSVRLKYEVLVSLVSLLVSIVYAYSSLQFRIEAQERAISTLCDKINILLAAKREPYKLECRDQ